MSLLWGKPVLDPHFEGRYRNNMEILNVVKEFDGGLPFHDIFCHNPNAEKDGKCQQIYRVRVSSASVRLRQQRFMLTHILCHESCLTRFLSFFH